jgi:hypothetical protein
VARRESDGDQVCISAADVDESITVVKSVISSAFAR